MNLWRTTPNLCEESGHPRSKNLIMAEAVTAKHPRVALRFFFLARFLSFVFLFLLLNRPSLLFSFHVDVCWSVCLSVLDFGKKSHDADMRGRRIDLTKKRRQAEC